MHGYVIYVSTYNVLFSTFKRQLTMIQQLYIHLATDSVITHAKFDFCMCTHVTCVFFILFTCPIQVVADLCCMRSDFVKATNLSHIS